MHRCSQPATRPRRSAGTSLRIRAWADSTVTGDRDELVPAPMDRAWRAVSVTAHECLGRDAVPVRAGVLRRAARERARHADVVVTNHAMLAIDAFAGIPLLPEHDVVVVDEAHELVDRATGAVTDELTAGMVERAARRVRRYVAPDDARRALVLSRRGAGRGAARDAARPGRPVPAGCCSTRWPRSATWPTSR